MDVNVAEAIDVSDDVTYNILLHNAVVFTNPQVTATDNGIVDGYTAIIEPVSAITFEGDYEMGGVTDTSYCPACIIQLYVAWYDPAAENGATPVNLGLWSGQTRTVGSPISTRQGAPSGHFTFESFAPTEAGIYYVSAGRSLQHDFIPTATGWLGNDTETGELDFASFMITMTNDFDSDGILNDQDQCPNTPLGSVVNGDGCAIEQLVQCDDKWKNHGQYVSTVAQTANSFAADGFITEPEKGAIVATAAQSRCGKKK